MRKLIGCLGGMLLHLFASVIWGVAAVLQLVGCLYLSFSWIYAPLAASPGARDGTGLIFVGLFAVFCAGVATAILCSLEASFIKRFLPDWEPPGTDD